MARKQLHKRITGSGVESSLLKEGEASSHVARLENSRISRSAAVHARLVRHVAGCMLFAATGFCREDENEELQMDGDEPMLRFSLTKGEMHTLFGTPLPAEHKCYNELLSAVEEVTASMRIMFSDMDKPEGLRAQFARKDDRPLSYRRVSDFEGTATYIQSHACSKRAKESAEVYTVFVTFPNMVDLPRRQAYWQTAAESFLKQLPTLKALQSHLDHPPVIGRG